MYKGKCKFFLIEKWHWLQLIVISKNNWDTSEMIWYEMNIIHRMWSWKVEGGSVCLNLNTSVFTLLVDCYSIKAHMCLKSTKAATPNSCWGKLKFQTIVVKCEMVFIQSFVSQKILSVNYLEKTQVNRRPWFFCAII